ncbi:MAG: ABC transporter ATP-binding protein/permease [Lachnospiraceae bacterium]|nr:ABC transporter ATP-binding protein/permease [Lachnospiraceae bacterium]
MFNTLKKFFDFCNEEDRKKFYTAIVLGVVKAIFAAFRIPAIFVIAQGIIGETNLPIPEFLKGPMSMTNVWLALGIMALSIIGQCLISLKTTMLQCEGGYHSCCNKRIEIAEHLRYLPMGFFNKNSLGRITNVTTNTMEQLGDVATRVVMISTQGMLTTAIIAIMVFVFDYRIGIILVIGLAFFVLFNALMQHAAKSVAPKKYFADEQLVSQVIQYVQGIAEVKNYNLTDKTAKKLEKAIIDKRDGDTNIELTVVPFMTLETVTTKLTGVVMCLSSIKFYFDGTMPLVFCIVMMVASFMIYDSLDAMGSFSALFRNIDVAVSEAAKILALPPMDIDGSDMTPENLDIELKNIGFSYESKKIINDVSLKIPQGSTAAIVGPSGGGKSTLCNLMARFWDVQEGEVLLGGKNVKDYSFDSLMKNFSFVFQRVYLFKDTIANNIRFGNPEASMEMVMEAAKKAKCHDFIMQLPDGYETVIGEGGASLSGGEKQRISIARAIMKDSPIIILDEATANVDPENEAQLSEAIDALTKDKTIIMIAHRLKTVRNADCIFVIDDGKIVQQGTHEELITQEGIYKSFVAERKEATSWKIA